MADISSPPSGQTPGRSLAPGQPPGQLPGHGPWPAPLASPWGLAGRPLLASSLTPDQASPLSPLVQPLGLPRRAPSQANPGGLAGCPEANYSSFQLKGLSTPSYATPGLGAGQPLTSPLASSLAPGQPPGQLPGHGPAPWPAPWPAAEYFKVSGNFEILKYFKISRNFEILKYFKKNQEILKF